MSRKQGKGGRLPWVKWYHRDWRSDPGLRMSGLAARGLWMDMLALMDEGEPYGHLAISGRPIGARDLAVMIGGATEREVASLLAKLEANGVFSRTSDGVILSRRMVRDNARREQGQENGRLGGNPNLVSAEQQGVNPDDAEGVNPHAISGVNPHNSEGVNPVLARAIASQKPEARTDRSSLRSDLCEIGSGLPDAPVAEERTRPGRKVGGQRGPEPEGFAEFYAAYPKHEARVEAAKAYPAAVKAAGGVEALMGHLRRCLPHFSPDRQFVPQPAKWLRNRRWEDEAPAPAASAVAVPGPDSLDLRYFGRPVRDVLALPEPRRGTPEFRAWQAAADGFPTPIPGTAVSVTRGAI